MLSQWSAVLHQVEKEKMAAQQKKNNEVGLFEEDDEFEEFPAEGIVKNITKT